MAADAKQRAKAKRDRQVRKEVRVKVPRNTPEPWERQAGEAERAYHAFEVYRDLEEERSFVKTANAEGLSQKTIEYYASRNAWSERVLAYDNYMVRARILERRKNIQRMQERHVNMAMMFQNRVAERLRTLNADDLSVDQTAKWFEIAVKIERQARGEEGDQPQVQVNIGQPSAQALGAGQGALMEYLDRNPQRIPALVPVIERFLSGDATLQDIDDEIRNGDGAPALIEESVGSDPRAVRPPDLGDEGSPGQVAEG